METIRNILMRLYRKLWEKRLRRNITLDERQKGFVLVDGCFENLKTLKQVITQQRKHRKEINIVFLDLAKPFNTISRKSIRKGLLRKGVHAQVIGTIEEMQVQVIQVQLQSTEISVGGKATQKMKINSAVKQGCPLSI